MSIASPDSPSDSAQQPASSLSKDEWQAAGFLQPAAIHDGFAVLRARYGLPPESERVLLQALSRSCDPDHAFFMLQRWLEAGGGAHVLSWTQPGFLNLLCALFAATPALSGYLIHFPERSGAILQAVLKREISGFLARRRLIQEHVRHADSFPTQLAALRRMRVECTLQIAALDLLGLSPLQDTVRALSDLADACVEVALDMAIERLRPRFGFIPNTRKAAATGGASRGSPSPPFVIFALGKLGGRELNYSSDIDLVFVHGGGEETSGTARPAEAGVYFTAVGEELIAILDRVTDDGRVYRVDLRLRPHGTAGPLVKSAREMLNYFQTEGRTWERQAWLKARPIAGDLELGEELLSSITPFIFRRYLSLDAISDMRALKRQIELSVARRGETDDEVKLGRGGIRDVEFTVQFMQLLHGGEHPHVRGGNTLRALYDLRREGLLADLDVEPLAEAYVFLRNVEHRLQLYGDLQVHRLPADPQARRRIARSLGYADRPQGGAEPAAAQEAFEADRVRHTTRTREVFQRLFANLFRDSGGPEGELCDLLLAPEPDIRKLAALLPHFGFAASEASARELVDLSRERLILTAPSRTRKFFASIAPQMLKALAATGEPEDALRRFSRIAGSLGAKAVFYQMLNENPWLLKMTADLAAWSEYLTDILVANPGLFDELVDALQTGQSKTAREMAAELAQIAAGGDIADTLRAYRAGELLRIGVRDLIHSASLEQTQGELTDLAEAILRTQLEHSLRAHAQRRGMALGPDGKPVRFAVLGLGKFGGREMNYGSDLDVIYFYGGEGQTPDSLPAVSYFAELAQELTRSMAAATALGPLYELDARLRPNGSKGPLALALEDFKRYWMEGQLADWERLALTRARFIAGDEGVGERALHLIRSAVYSPLKDTAALSREVIAMRRRLEENADPDDLKRGPGGIMDIEFIVQYLQLIHGPAFPPLRQSNTEQALKTLVKFKKLSATDGGTLLGAYEFLRRMENRVRIVHGLSSHKLPQKIDALRKLALRAGYADAEGKRAEERLKEDFCRHARASRDVFERLLAGA